MANKKKSHETKVKKAVEETTTTKVEKTVVAHKKDCKTLKFLKELTSCKHDKSENILTIFSKPSIYGGMMAEFIGVMILTTVLLMVGIGNILTLLVFIFMALSLLFHGISGANFNPLVTAGMVATRRMSIIRGVMYIIAQVFGAWAGYGIAILFSSSAKDVEPQLQSMAKLGENIHLVIMIELIGAIVIGLFFARAMFYKKNALIFASTIASGMVVAVILALVLSGASRLQNNFILNPAIALSYQILPNSGANFGELLKGVNSAMGVYFIIPMIGGIIGFYLNDIMAKLTDNVKEA